MSDHYELSSHQNQVRYLAESVKEVQNRDNPKRKLMMVLLYWKVFDHIDIPAETMKSIMDHGTNPETILRSLRHVNTDILQKAILEGEQNDEDDRTDT